MALIAKQYRGTLADLYHYGHIVVADTEGKILWQLGNPDRVTYARSSAKLFQAIPIIESGAVDTFGITDSELSFMCASHRGEEFHTDAALSILKKAGLDESYLQCGIHYPYAPYMETKLKAEGKEPTVLHNNCSGKHSGFLITAKKLGYSLDDYYATDHPLQKAVTDVLSSMCDYPADKIEIGIDGCGMPVHAMPLYKFAQGLARMSKPDTLDDTRAKAVARITNAITTHPEMINGTDGFTTELMQAFGDRLFSKSGANAYYAIGLKDKGIGIVMKMEDGASNIVPIAILETLVQIGVITRDEAESLPSHKPVEILRNHKKEEIGRVVAEFVLEEK